MSSKRIEEGEALLSDLVKLSEAGNGASVAAATVAEPGGVPALAERAVRGGTPRIKAMALGLLRCMSEASADACDAIGKAGAIGPLVKLISTANTPAEHRLEASRAMAFLVRGHAGNQDLAVAAGAVPPVLKLLTPSAATEESEALAALSILCAIGANPKHAHQVASKGTGTAALARHLLPHATAVGGVPAFSALAGRPATAAAAATGASRSDDAPIGHEAALQSLLAVLNRQLVEPLNQKSPESSGGAPGGAPGGAAAAPPRAAVAAMRMATEGLPDLPTSSVDPALLAGLVRIAAGEGAAVGKEATGDGATGTGEGGASDDDADAPSPIAGPPAVSAVALHAAAAVLILSHETPPAALVESGVLGLCVNILGHVSSSSTTLGMLGTSETLVRHAGALLLHLARTTEGYAELMQGAAVPQLVRSLTEAGPVEQEAIVALLRALCDHTEAVTALDRAAAHVPLVRLANGQCTSSTEAREGAAALLCRLCEFGALLPPLLAAGAPAPLLAQLRQATTSEQRLATEALQRLTLGAEGRIAVAETPDGVASLVAAVANGAPDVRTGCLAILRRLAEGAKTIEAVSADPDAVNACVGMLRERSGGQPQRRRSSFASPISSAMRRGSSFLSTPKHAAAFSSSTEAAAAEQAAACLACLIEAGRAADVPPIPGAMESLSALVAKRNDPAAGQAMRALCGLASEAAAQEAIVGSLAHLFELGKGSDQARSHLVSTVHKLARDGSESTRRAVAASTQAISLLLKALESAQGAPNKDAPALASFLALGAPKEVRQDTEALASLLALADRPETLATIVNSGGLPPIVAAAQSHEDPGARKAAVSLLCHASSPPHTTAVAKASGAVEVLIRALQSDVSPAEDRSQRQRIAAALEHLVVVPAARPLVASLGVAACADLVLWRNEAVQLSVVRVLESLCQDASGLAAVGAAGADVAVARAAQLAKAIPARRAALRALCSLLEDEGIRRRLVHSGAGVALIESLRDGDAKEQKAASAALELLSKVPGGAEALRNAGGVRVLVDGLTAGGPSYTRMAVLRNLAESADSARAVASDVSAVAACVQMLNGPAEVAHKTHAAAALACLSAAGRRADIIRTDGSIEGLVALLRTKKKEASAQAARALSSLADDKASHARIVEAMAQLTELAKSSGEGAVHAAATVRKLSGGGDQKVQEALGESDEAAAVLVQELAGLEGSPEAHAQAVYSLLQLKDRPAVRQAIVDGGGLDPLVVMGTDQAANEVVDPEGRIGLRARNERLNVLKLIACLARDHGAAVAASGGVELLMSSFQMRAQGDTAMAQEAAGALMQLTDTPEGRAAMLSGGGVANCIRLLKATNLSGTMDTVQLHALDTLVKLCSDEEGSKAIIAEVDSAHTMVQLCPVASKQGRNEVPAKVTQVLCSLAKIPDARAWLIRAGSIVPIVVMLSRVSGEAEEPLAAALDALTADVAGQVATAAAGGAEALVHALLQGSPGARASAMHALRALAEHVPTRAAVAASPSAAQACVPLLGSHDAEVLEHTAATLACLAEAGCTAEVVAAGAVSPLTALLQRSIEARVQAARAICALSEDSSQLGVLCHACLPAIVALAESNGEAQEYAVTTLFNLAAKGGAADAGDELLAAIARTEPAMKLLLLKLAEGTTDEQSLAAKSLLQLAAHPESVSAIVKGGGVPALVRVAESHDDAPTRGHAISLLAALALHKSAVAAVAPAVGVLLSALGGSKDGGSNGVGGLAAGTRTVQIVAALEQIVGASPEARSALVQAGCSKLVQLLRHDAAGAQLHALGALGGLAADDDGRRAVCAAGGARELTRIAKGRTVLTGASRRELLAPSPQRRGSMRRGSSVSAVGFQPKSKAAATKAALILCSLAMLGEACDELVAAGAFVPLVVLLRDGTPEERTAAAAATERLTGQQRSLAVTKLQAVTRDIQSRKVQSASLETFMGTGADPTARGRISAVAEGVLGALFGVLLQARGGASDADKLQAHAIRVVANIAEGVETRHAVAAETDAVAACLLVLDSAKEASAQEHAAATLAWLLDAGRRGEAITKGATKSLVGALKRGGAERVQASRALCSLASDAGCHAALGQPGLAQVVAVATTANKGKAQQYAAATLHKLALGGNEDVVSMIARDANAVGALVQQLSGGGGAAQRDALASLLALATRPEALAAIVGGGGLQTIVAAAQSHEDAGARKAAVSLLCLASPPHTSSVAKASGAVEVLMRALQKRKPYAKETSWLDDAPLLRSIAASLARLVAEPSACIAMSAFGAAPLVRLLHSEDERVRVDGLGALEGLAGTPEGLRAINAAAPTPALLSVLGRGSESTEEGSIRLVDRLLADAASCKALVEAGGIGQVLPLLFSRVVPAQEHVVSILAKVAHQLSDLTSLSDACNKATIFGLSELLIRAGLDPKCQQDTAAIFALLARHPPNAVWIIGSGAAHGLAQVAQPSFLSSEGAKQHALAALEALGSVVAQRFASRLKGSPLLRKPLFWSADVVAFLGDDIERRYPKVTSALGGYAPTDFYIELFLFCAMVVLRQDEHESEAHQAGELGMLAELSAESPSVSGKRGRKLKLVNPLRHTAVQAIQEVMESLENEPNALRFVASIWPDVIARTKAPPGFDSFADFDIDDVPDLAHYGVEVLNRVSGMPLAEKAITALYKRYLKDEKPTDWKDLFKEATRTAYNLKVSGAPAASCCESRGIIHHAHALPLPSKVPMQLFRSEHSPNPHPLPPAVCRSRLASTCSARACPRPRRGSPPRSRPT